MTQDEFSRGTFYYDSFGARRVLGWLVTGRIFDNHRFPVVERARPDRPRGLRVAVPSERDRSRRPCRGTAQPAVVLRAPDARVRDRPAPGWRPTCSCVATSPACIWPASTWRGSAARGWGRRRCTWFARAPSGCRPAFAAAALGIVLIGRGRAGGGRALLVRTDRRRVDLGAARRPVDGGRRLRLARRDGQGDRSRPDLRRHAREQGSAQDPVRPRVRRPAEPRRRCRGVHPPHVVADVERGEPVRRTRRRAGGHVRRALGRLARRT